MSYARLYENKSEMADFRKRLRKQLTKAEQILWYELKGEKLGYKFRRQFSIGRVVADFCCSPLRLIVELDGPVHNNDYQKDYDKRRDAWLRKQKYVVLRFKNDDVIFYKREEILKTIKSWCDKLQRRKEDGMWGIK